mmetsp:Transcript_125372/g.279744  ORF Transcript_125372/g.279744 Transcript_125372/m.279744 type:complete len:205 (-) Transcript_125372:39-653(-)
MIAKIQKTAGSISKIASTNFCTCRNIRTTRSSLNRRSKRKQRNAIVCMRCVSPERIGMEISITPRLTIMRSNMFHMNSSWLFFASKNVQPLYIRRKPISTKKTATKKCATMFQPDQSISVSRPKHTVFMRIINPMKLLKCCSSTKLNEERRLPESVLSSRAASAIVKARRRSLVEDPKKVMVLREGGVGSDGRGGDGSDCAKLA